MATDLERLVVSLSADIKAYERALAKAQGVTTSALRKIETDGAKSMGRFEKTMGRAGSALAGFGKGLVIGGIATAVSGLGAIVASSVQTASAIGDLSDKLGITSDKLQELQFGAVQANLSFEGLEGGLLKFNKALAQAQNGSGDLLKTLEANGFTKAQIKALSYSEALDVVADLIKNARNEQDAFLITTQAFGKGNDEFAEFLRGGSAGLKQFAKDAHDADAIIKEGLIKSAQAFDDAWSRGLLSVKSKLGDFVLSALPLIAKLDQAVSDAADRLGVSLGTLNPAIIDTTSPVSGPKSRSSRSEKSDRQPVTKLFDPEVDAAAKAAAKDLAREKEKQAAAIEKVIDALILEGQNLGKSNVQQEVATALARADVDARSAQGERIKALVEANELHRASLEAVAFAAEQYASRQEDFADSLHSLAEAGVDAFSQWAIEGDKLSDVITNLAKSLLQASVQASLLGQGPLAGLFGTSQGGGLFSSLFQQPKLYAKGGQIASGQMGIAGEAGPELIQGPANVIPFNKLRGGGTNVQIIDQRTNAPQIEKQRGQDGSLKFIVRDAVNDIIGSGQADAALRNRHGVVPQKARR